jgi:hypothetical protein
MEIPHTLFKRIHWGFNRKSDATRAEGWYVQMWLAGDSLSMDVDAFRKHFWIVIG